MEENVDFKGKFTIGQFIDHYGVNGRTWVLFFLLGFAMLFEGYDSGIVNFTLPSIQAEWSLNSAVTGSLASWSLIGLVIGGVFAGLLADKFGRKRVLVVSVIIFGLLNLPLYFAQDWMFFAFFRVAAGVGLGSCIPMVTTCFSEWMPSKNRGFFITFGMAWMILGTVIAGLVGGALCDSAAAAAIVGGQTTYEAAASISLPFTPGLHIDYWRVTYFIGFLPLFYAVVLHFAMPETPHFYASRGDMDKCVETLRTYEKRVTGGTEITASLTPDQLIVPQKKQGEKRPGPGALFSKKFIRGTLAIWIGYFCGCMVLYGQNAFLPRMCGALGYTYTLATIAMAAAFIANVSCGWVADRIGRKRTVAIGFASGAVCVALSGMACLQGWTYETFVVVMILLGFTVNFGQTAIQPLMPETYPAELRGTGTSWCQAVGRIGGALGPIILGMLVDANMGGGATAPEAMGMAFMFMVIPAAVAAIAIMVLVKKDTAGTSIDTER